jgi:hypothetical protein
MPTVSNVELTLTTISSGGADQVKIKVQYDVEFTTFERQLVDLGLTYHTHVTIHDFDGGATPGDQILDFSPSDRKVITPTVGTGRVSQTYKENTTVTRSSLQVDPAGDEVELKAFVRVHANEWFDEFSPGSEPGAQEYPDDAVSTQVVLTA